jgi:hypothetical protein
MMKHDARMSYDRLHRSDAFTAAKIEGGGSKRESRFLDGGRAFYEVILPGFEPWPAFRRTLQSSPTRDHP